VIRINALKYLSRLTVAKGSSAAVTKSSSNCVIYTRVSTKEQADTNLSLETQQKACSLYAEKLGYPVLSNFGGTYESAQTDERKQFTAMLAFVKKSKQKVSYIIVYSLERFSRNDNSIWLSGQLRKLGIEIVSVTQPIDTSNPSGQMQQKMLFLFGEFDNQLRKQKCMAGVKEMLLRGDWPTMPPLGYDAVRVNGKRSIIINAKGKLLKQAFHWKSEGLSSETVRALLSEKGLKVSKQHISIIFRNPFYCGMISHNLLEGKVIKGNQEPIISQQLFLKVNGVLAKNAQGYKINEENEAIPLKRFVRCDECGSALRGYIVQKKKIYYYKCNTVGCGNNKSAKSLNGSFANILNYFSIGQSADLNKLIRKQSIATFNQLSKGSQEEYQLLHTQYQGMNKKIERLEERFIEEEINADLYNKFYEKYKEEKGEIEANLIKAGKQVSNLEECVDLTLDFAAKMATEWHSADYLAKQEIQFLLFPDGITYNKKTDKCRTSRINVLFAYATDQAENLGDIEKFCSFAF
jgi:site-specific DNA recombinase